MHIGWVLAALAARRPLGTVHVQVEARGRVDVRGQVLPPPLRAQREGSASAALLLARTPEGAHLVLVLALFALEALAAQSAEGGHRFEVDCPHL